MNFFENAVIFDRFKVVEKLEDGTFFTSYLGKDLDSGSKVFIKILNPNTYTRYEVDKICFSNEMPIIRFFDNKNIQAVIEAGSYSNTMCIVSEYVDSINLTEFLNGRGALDLNTAINLILQLANALQYAHSKNIIHRGVKAGSIIICDSNGEFVLKLTDFGLSHILDYSNTPSDEIDECFGFMAPESTGLLDHKVDARSDLYSLGILFYRFITGTFPFHADTIDNMVYQHVAVMPKAPKEFNPSIPDAVSNLVLKLLMKDPDKRYQSANEVINELDMFKASADLGGHLQNDDILQTLDSRSKLLVRKAELSQLRNYYTKALEGPGRFCLVSGDLGCGKSDLFANLCSELDASGTAYFRAHFSAQSSLTPYSAFHDILHAFAHRFEQYDRRLQMLEHSRLTRTIMGLSNLVTSICSDMKTILTESAALPALTNFKEQQRSIMLLAKFFLSLLPSDPYIIILDDIHFADAASLALLTEMAGTISDTKLFVVCSCRSIDSTDSAALASFLNLFNKNEMFNSIVLPPFDETRACEFLSDLLILDKVECQTLAHYIVDKTGGNPYFTVNVVRSMLEDNVISINNGMIEHNWEQLRIISRSEDLFNLIDRRISRLSPETVNLLEIAAVIGDNFNLKLLSVVADVEIHKLRQLIAPAIDFQFVDYSSSSDLMEFAHRDIHTAFLDRILAEDLKKLHYKIAKAIETLYEGEEPDVYALVYHYTEADSEEDVRRFIMDAASLARYSHATNEALSYYRKALGLIESKDGKGNESWCIAVSALIDLTLAIGDCKKAIALANELKEYLPDEIETAKLNHRIGLAYYRLGNFVDSEKYYIEALNCLGEKFPTKTFYFKMGKSIDHDLRLARVISSDKTKSPADENTKKRIRIASGIYESLCWIYAFNDISKFNCIALRDYSNVLHTLGSSDELGACLSALAVENMFEADDSASNECMKHARDLRTEFGNESGQAECTFFSGISYQWRGDIEHSIKCFKEAAEGFAGIGDSWQYNNTMVFLCNSYQMVGDYKTALTLCDECIETSQKLNDNFSLALAYICSMACYTESGNYAAAEAILNVCKPVIYRLNFDYCTVLFCIECGRLNTEIGKYQDAVNILTKAKDIIHRRHMSPQFIPKVYGYLAIAACRQLEKERISLSLSEIQNTEIFIANMCDLAKTKNKNRPINQIISQRASAKLGILIENFKRSDLAFKEALMHTSFSQYHYETAMLHLDYGKYLLDKHRTSDARYYIFEAYMIFSHISSDIRTKECEGIIAAKYQEEFRNSPLLSDVTARRNRMNVDRKVNTLLRLGERLTSTLELDELQRKILQDAVELVGAERGILFLYPDSGEHKLFVASVYNLGSFDTNTYDWMLDEVERNRKPIVINDVQSDEYRKHYSVMARYGIKSVMAMPMFVRGVLFGVIYLDSRLVRQIFTPDYIEAMGFIANQAGAPIENARLYHRAITDGLTGIYGRSYLDNLVVDRTQDASAQVAAIMIDVDNFKRCNDTYGHPFGDKVLKKIASIMKSIASDIGTPCRYGGEEFVVIVNSNDPELVVNVAEQIRAAVQSTTLVCTTTEEPVNVSITISLGVSIWNSEMERIDLIEHADKALYYAKTHGKNQVVLWNESL